MQGLLGGILDRRIAIAHSLADSAGFDNVF